MMMVVVKRSSYRQKQVNHLKKAGLKNNFSASAFFAIL